jgi:hypothetical protein
MAFLMLAVLASVVAITLARRRYLHPGDYLVVAVLAVLLAWFVVVLSPSEVEHQQLVGHGTPAGAVARSAFLLDHGAAIELASMLTAAGALVAAVVRRRASPEQFA